MKRYFKLKTGKTSKRLNFVLLNLLLKMGLVKLNIPL